ncbi:MAG TPA: PA2779 family protein [Burkholderiales bacterium]|nr:PA2779 family protein [Burkholderiales bacterium]
MNAFRRFVAAFLIGSTLVTGVSAPVHAALLPTDAAVAAAGDRDRVNAMLERAEVRARLEAHGVRAEDVGARLAALSDDEVSRLARSIDTLPAGGDGIIGAIIFVFLILLITDILGLTKIFPFTRPIR